MRNHAVTIDPITKAAAEAALCGETALRSLGPWDNQPDFVTCPSCREQLTQAVDAGRGHSTHVMILVDDDG